MTVNALVRNSQIQKIATGAGLLTASVMFPTVAVSLMTTLGMKYAIDKVILGNDKGLLDEINDIIKVGNVVTKSASDKILSPTLKYVDRGISNLGKNYQNKIDDIFR